MKYDDIHTLLVADQGIGALRAIRAARDLGVRAVAVYAKPHEHSLHVKLADSAVCIGDDVLAYNNARRIIQAAKSSYATIIHTGFSDLGRDVGFVREVEKEGFLFAGPSLRLLSIVSERARLEKAVVSAGIPLVPKSGPIDTDSLKGVAYLASVIGYPLLVKGSAEHSHTEIAQVESLEALQDTLLKCLKSSHHAQGEQSFYIERCMRNRRVVTLDVLGDAYGNVVWIGDREVTLQHENKTILTESPVKDFSRAAMAVLGGRCVQMCRSIGLVGTASIDLIYDAGEFYFGSFSIGANIDQAVTEQVTVVDMAREQIGVALGGSLSVRQKKIRLRGSAIATRVTASSSNASASVVEHWRAAAGQGVRVDSHFEEGYVLPAGDRELAAFIVAHGLNREVALAKILGAMAELRVDGIALNHKLIRELLSCNEFVSVDVIQQGLAKIQTFDKPDYLPSTI